MQRGVLRILTADQLAFYCPGCLSFHVVRVALAHQGDTTGPVVTPHPAWTFDGNHEKPTFGPSILVRSGHYSSGHEPDERCGCDWNREEGLPNEPPFLECYVCHSFVRQGMIQFLTDSTHHLSGQTVALLPPDEAARRYAPSPGSTTLDGMGQPLLPFDGPL